MHWARPHLLLEEFLGFQLKTVISVNPCLWCLNICNSSHCSGFSSIQVHGVTCHSPADMFQASSSKFFSPLQALLCTPASCQGWWGEENHGPLRSQQKTFHLLLQSPCRAFPAGPASAWGVSQLSPQWGVFKLCLDYSVLCKLWCKKRESLRFPVKEKRLQK